MYKVSYTIRENKNNKCGNDKKHSGEQPKTVHTQLARSGMFKFVQICTLAKHSIPFPSLEVTE